MCKQSSRLRNKEEAVAAQRHCLECITMLNQAVESQSMALHEVKRRAKYLTKLVAAHGATIATAYFCLEATKTSK